MTIKEKLARVGTEATVKMLVSITDKMEKLTVDVIVKDYKSSYGRDRWLVSPKSGSGQIWAENVEFKSKTK
jgi:hypothetical protein